MRLTPELDALKAAVRCDDATAELALKQLRQMSAEIREAQVGIMSEDMHFRDVRKTLACPSRRAGV